MKAIMSLVMASLLSFAAQAQSSNAAKNDVHFRKITIVNSAVFTGERKERSIELNYPTGGCDLLPAEIKLELVSITDRTPKWALEKNPQQIREYQVVVNAVILETQPDAPICAMYLEGTVKANLQDLFRKQAAEFKIDLDAKKAHYSIHINAPTVAGATSFSAFD